MQRSTSWFPHRLQCICRHRMHRTKHKLVMTAWYSRVYHITIIPNIKPVRINTENVTVHSMTNTLTLMEFKQDITKVNQHCRFNTPYLICILWSTLRDGSTPWKQEEKLWLHKSGTTSVYSFTSLAKLTGKNPHLGQEGGAVLQPPLAANEHHVPAALRRTVYRELEKERGLPAVTAARKARKSMRRGVR